MIPEILTCVGSISDHGAQQMMIPNLQFRQLEEAEKTGTESRLDSAHGVSMAANRERCQTCLVWGLACPGQFFLESQKEKMDVHL